MDLEIKSVNEITDLLNPAFCGEIIRNCIKKFEETAKCPMPFPLVFLILPFVLNEEIRKRMRYAASQKLPLWIIENEKFLIDFDVNTRRLLSFALDSLVFLKQQKAISINEQGEISIGTYEIPKKYENTNEEVLDCYKKSRYVGGWFGTVNDAQTIYSILGVRP